MSGRERRRERRIPVQVSVRLGDSKEEAELTTEDVSRFGLFIRTEQPKQLRQLLRLRIKIDETDEVVAHGMVVRIVTVEEAARAGGSPGMGIEFYGLGGEPRQKWDEFVRQHRRKSGMQSVDMPRPVLGQQPPAGVESRSEPRIRAVFPVMVPTIEDLYEVYTRDISVNGMFLCTTEKLGVGSPVVLRIVHPANQAVFQIDGVVRHVHDDPQYPGLGIQLVHIDEQRREQFRQFIVDGMPTEDVTAEEILDIDVADEFGAVDIADQLGAVDVADEFEDVEGEGVELQVIDPAGDPDRTDEFYQRVGPDPFAPPSSRGRKR